MTLLDGIHHVATLTADLDRLISFYDRVFDAPVTLDLTEEGLRHAFIELGPQTVLHPFSVPGIDVSQHEVQMFERGRLDHIALHASSEETFRELRRRVVTEGAGDGIVTDMGALLTFGFTDPDGAQHEIVWVKPDVSIEHALPRAEWKTVEMD